MENFQLPSPVDEAWPVCVLGGHLESAAMLTRIRQHIMRAPADRRSWLLAAVLLGVLGMHGFVSSSEASASHHAWAPAAVAAQVTPDHAMHYSPGHAPAAVAVADDAPGQPDDDALALCMALVLAIAVAAGGIRRTTWTALLDRRTVSTRTAPAPAPGPSSPVPRFTVMRC